MLIGESFFLVGVRLFKVLACFLEFVNEVVEHVLYVFVPHVIYSLSEVTIVVEMCVASERWCFFITLEVTQLVVVGVFIFTLAVE